MEWKKAFLLVLALSTASLYAQKGELGVTGGVSLYSGDLAPREFGIYFQELNPAFGFFGRLNFNKTFSARLGVSFAQVSGADANGGSNVDRGLQFRSNITEAALTLELNLFRIGSAKGVQLAPYVFGGGGIFRFNPEGFFDNGWVALQPLRTEAQGAPGYEAPYELTNFSIPLGLGLKVAVKRNVVLGFEFGGRKTFTDFLDDISSQRVRYRDVLENSGTRAAQLSEPRITSLEDFDQVYSRGGRFDDWYYLGNVTLSFFLNGGNRGWNGGRGIGCPTFR